MYIFEKCLEKRNVQKFIEVNLYIYMVQRRPTPQKNCRKAGAGACIGYGVSAHLIHYHKFSPKKTFHATSSVF